MAKTSRLLLRRLQQEVQMTDLCYHYNIELQPNLHGNKLHGYCPFHEDTSLSLLIDPKTNRWKCRTPCSKGGGNIRFVMKLENISFQEAIKTIQSLIETKIETKNLAYPSTLQKSLAKNHLISYLLI